MNLNIHIGLILTIILISIGNIAIKIAMNRVDKTKGIITAYILNPFFIAGTVSLALALPAYSYVLTDMKLSVVYPVMVSSCFVIVLPVSHFYFKENISLIQIIGIILITAGIWLVLK